MADWGDGVSASCTVGLVVRYMDNGHGHVTMVTGNGWPHNGLWHHWLMPISCHFRDCKALLAGASTPYKRWSKCTMEKVGGGTFLQKLRGEVH